MKNTITIDVDNNCSCECVDSVSDGTNQIILDCHSTKFENPSFLLSDGETETTLSVQDSSIGKTVKIPFVSVSKKDIFWVIIRDSSIEQEMQFSNKDITDQSLIVKNTGIKKYLVYMKVIEPSMHIATKESIGQVQIGDNLTITDEGILSAEVSANDIKKIEEEIQSMKDGGLGKGILRTINAERHNKLGAVTGLFNGTSDIHPRYGTLTTYLEVE